MLPRFLPLALLVVAASTLTPVARAGWQELHETSDDVRIVVEPDGNATVEHRLRYRVVAGHFKTIDLTGIDPRAQLSPEVTLGLEKGGGEVVARVEPLPKSPGTLRIMIDEGKGLGRGTYIGVVRYRMDFVATKMLTRDGAMWKLTWTAPATPEGHDGARVIFDVPSAPTEPRLAGVTETTTTLATLRRGTERDELELVRAHVPRGEAVAWAARIDPRALSRVTAPELRPPPAPPASAPALIGSNLARILVACGFALLAGGLAMLLREKQRAVSAAAEERGLTARPLVALPGAPFAYGIVSAFALAVLLWSHPVGGAALTVLAMALAVHRAPASPERPRARGSWSTASDIGALLAPKREPLPTDALDIGTWRGRLTALALALAVAAGAFFLRTQVPQIAIALPLSAAALVPIFVTGTRAQLPKTPVEIGMAMLRPARDAIAAKIDLAHAKLEPIVRVVEARGAVDEVRLACVPREPTPGLLAIELAVAGESMPEVIVRYDGASPVADRVAQVVARGSLGPGHVPTERTMRVLPVEPTAEAAADLVAELALALEERRRVAGAADPARRRARGFHGLDRRRPQGLFVVERAS